MMYGFFTYDRMSFPINWEPSAGARSSPAKTQQMQCKVQLQGRLPTCITDHAFLGGAHKTWPLGLTFVAMLGELASQT
jgi:hypothetical protein